VWTLETAVSRRTDFEIADAVSAISAAPDPKACSRIFRKAIAAFKIDSFACGEIDLAALERTVFYAIGWPDTWHKFYVGSGVILRDPVVTALKQRHGPFTWSELRRDGKFPAAGTKALQVVAEHGWTEGLAVPIPHGDQRFGLVTMLCQRHAFDADEKSVLAMLSYCFYERLRNLVPKHGFAIPPVGLTRREIDTLRLIARGATDRDVARKLGISPSTAHEHFEKAKRKLKVSTRAEAIAIAVSLAIIAR
jgi:LuxR family transcriptional regulator, quorum-sensing system regulator BjaR1